MLLSAEVAAANRQHPAPRPEWLEQKAKKKENLVKCPLLILICSVIIQHNCFIYPLDTSQYNAKLLREERAEQNERTYHFQVSVQTVPYDASEL